MLTTAKSIQLLDASGMNISPITDITSLYYEVENPNNKGIISRKYIYDEFPVGVNIDPTTEVSIGASTGSGERHPENNPLYENGQLYKIVGVNDNNGNIIKEDILVSNVSTYIMKGTTLREIKVKNYNLSEILSYYTPLDLMDASCHALDISINNINSSIDDISTRIHELKTSLDTSSCTLSEIIDWCKNNVLVPNKFYLINNYYVNYYVGDNGCMPLPDPDTNFSGPDSNNSLSLLVKANDTSTLDGKLYEMYNVDDYMLKVHGTYKIEDDKVYITYMKDQYGNEAPYDFYNLKYNGKYTYTDQETDNIYNAIISLASNVKNNIIKTDPYTFYSMPIFKLNDGSMINNYIGYDTSIYLSAIQIKNNYIGNNDGISLNEFQTNNSIENNIIGNNNTIKANNFSCSNIIIENNNNIDISSNLLTNLTVKSSNNIKLYNNANNVIILNNCNGTIYLASNTIIDNYIYADNQFNASANSIYLFKQDIYARSFNTINTKKFEENATLFTYVDDTQLATNDTTITQDSYLN